MKLKFIIIVVALAIATIASAEPQRPMQLWGWVNDDTQQVWASCDNHNVAWGALIPQGDKLIYKMEIAVDACNNHVDLYSDGICVVNDLPIIPATVLRVDLTYTRYEFYLPIMANQ